MADEMYVFDPRIHMNLTKNEIWHLDKLEEYEKLLWMVDVAFLKTGDSFGELALISDEPRKATITCLSNCFFACLEKKEYNKILRKLQVRDNNKKIDFINHLPVFQSQT